MIAYTLSDASGESSGYSYLTLDEIKNYCEVDASADNDLLTEMYYAVAEEIETRYKQILKNRDIVLRFDKREKYIATMFRPVTAITSVSYRTADDTSGTLTDLTDYKSYGLPDSRVNDINLNMYRDWDELVIELNCDGRDATNPVPYGIKMATLAWIKVLFDERVFFDRDSIPPPPAEAIHLLRKYEQIII